MDSFAWAELQRGVEELGHGSVKFYHKDKHGELVELKIDSVMIREKDEEVEVTLVEW